MTCELTREVVADLRISGLVSQMDAMIRRGVKPERCWLLALNHACHVRRNIRKETAMKSIGERLQESLVKDIEQAREDARRYHVLKSAGDSGRREISDAARMHGDFDASVDTYGAQMLRVFCGTGGSA